MACITVIIPTFNQQALLLETIRSVFAQTFQDYELVVVDDGSTDATRQALAPYEHRLRYVWKENGGEASARNRGIREARCRFIAFLDHDDLWDPGFLATTITHMETHPSLGLVSTGSIRLPDGKQHPGFRKGLLQGDLFPLLFRRNFITTSGVVVRREVFDRVGLFNEPLRFGVDYDMWLRIAKEYPIALLNRPLCKWRHHAGNISKSELLQLRTCVLQLIESHSRDPRISPRLSRTRRSKLMVSLGRVYVKLDRLGEAVACFRGALALAPFSLRPLCCLATARLVERARSFLGIINERVH